MHQNWTEEWIFGETLGLCVTKFEGRRGQWCVCHSVWILVWIPAYLSTWNINHQQLHFVRVPKRTIIVLSEDTYFAAKAGSCKVYIDNRTALFHTRQNSNNAIAAAASGDCTSVVGSHNSKDHVTTSVSRTNVD